MQDKTKVAIIGAGGVGTTAALLLAMRADLELVVVDIPGGPAAGRLTDLNQAGKLLGFEPDHLGTHDYSEIAGARVVVITAGSPRSGSSWREALLDGNLGVVRGAAREVRKYAPDAVVIVVTNPVEPHCHAVVTATGFPPRAGHRYGAARRRRTLRHLRGGGVRLGRSPRTTSKVRWRVVTATTSWCPCRVKPASTGGHSPSTSGRTRSPASSLRPVRGGDRS